MRKEKEDDQYFSFNKKAIKLHYSSCSCIKQINFCVLSHTKDEIL